MICGVDEAGRGPLAGPVFAAAVILGPAHGIPGRVRIVRRPFAAGTLPENAAQLQENEDRKRQKDDGVNVEHVLLAFGGR